MANWADRLAKLAQALATAGTVPDTSISTAETDVDLRLAPDGAGGVEWGTGGAGGGGGRVVGLTQSLVQEECFHTPNTTTLYLDGGVRIVVSGGAVGAVVGEPSHPGVIGIYTGIGTTGRSVLAATVLTCIELGAATTRFGIVGKAETAVSDGTNRYTLRMGLGDSSAAEHVDGVFFRVVDNVNGGNWQGVCRANNVESVVDTGVAADFDVWHSWEFEVNDDATSTEFFIDGVSVGTVTTDIPSGSARLVGLVPAGIIKSLGTTERVFRVDAYWYHFDFTTTR